MGTPLISLSIRSDLRWCVCGNYLLFSLSSGFGICFFFLGRYSIFFGAGNTERGTGSFGLSFSSWLITILIFDCRHILDGIERTGGRFYIRFFGMIPIFLL